MTAETSFTPEQIEQLRQIVREELARQAETAAAEEQQRLQRVAYQVLKIIQERASLIRLP